MTIRSKLFLPLLVLLFLSFVPSRALGQYVESNLDANTSALSPAHVDTNLVDGWGLSFFPTSPFWISDQNTSVATLYKADGTPIPLVVQIPCVVSGSATAPCPTPVTPVLCRFPVPCSSVPPFFGPSGTVSNPFAAQGAFSVTMGGTTKPALFLFSTLDDLIVGWNPGVNLTQAAVGADQSSSGAIYFGLALAGPASSPHLYAANGAGMIDVFDQSFNLVNSFAADPHPGLFTPYGIQVIGNNLYVTYAAAPPVFGGILDVCDLSTSTTNPKCHRLFYSPPTSEESILDGPWA